MKSRRGTNIFFRKHRYKMSLLCKGLIINLKEISFGGENSSFRSKISAVIILLFVFTYFTCHKAMRCHVTFTEVNENWNDHIILLCFWYLKLSTCPFTCLPDCLSVCFSVSFIPVIFLHKRGEIVAPTTKSLYTFYYMIFTQSSKIFSCRSSPRKVLEKNLFWTEFIKFSGKNQGRE